MKIPPVIPLYTVFQAIRPPAHINEFSIVGNVVSNESEVMVLAPIFQHTSAGHDRAVNRRLREFRKERSMDPSEYASDEVITLNQTSNKVQIPYIECEIRYNNRTSSYFLHGEGRAVCINTEYTLRTLADEVSESQYASTAVNQIVHENVAYDGVRTLAEPLITSKHEIKNFNHRPIRPHDTYQGQCIRLSDFVIENITADPANKTVRIFISCDVRTIFSVMTNEELTSCVSAEHEGRLVKQQWRKDQKQKFPQQQVYLNDEGVAVDAEPCIETRVTEEQKQRLNWEVERRKAAAEPPREITREEDKYYKDIINKIVKLLTNGKKSITNSLGLDDAQPRDNLSEPPKAGSLISSKAENDYIPTNPYDIKEISGFVIAKGNLAVSSNAPIDYTLAGNEGFSSGIDSAEIDISSEFWNNKEAESVVHDTKQIEYAFLISDGILKYKCVMQCDVSRSMYGDIQIGDYITIVNFTLSTDTISDSNGLNKSNNIANADIPELGIATGENVKHSNMEEVEQCPDAPVDLYEKRLIRESVSLRVNKLERGGSKNCEKIFRFIDWLRTREYAPFQVKMDDQTEVIGLADYQYQQIRDVFTDYFENFDKILESIAAVDLKKVKTTGTTNIGGITNGVFIANSPSFTGSVELGGHDTFNQLANKNSYLNSNTVNPPEFRPKIIGTSYENSELSSVQSTSELMSETETTDETTIEEQTSISSFGSSYLNPATIFGNQNPFNGAIGPSVGTSINANKAVLAGYALKSHKKLEPNLMKSTQVLPCIYNSETLDKNITEGYSPQVDISSQKDIAPMKERTIFRQIFTKF